MEAGSAAHRICAGLRCLLRKENDMFNRLKARRERRQQEKQARYKIQGLMDLVK
jgi:hypothetical protein